MNNSRLAILLILLALSYAVFRHKELAYRQSTLTDRFTKAASTLIPLLQPGSAMLVENTSDAYEFPARSRYVLAPAYVAFSGDYDTVLCFAAKDKPLTEASSGRKIIWQQTDDLYQYSLSVKTLTCIL